MDEDIVGDILKDSRKPRKYATCYPCQRRKVKCDRGRPCEVCVTRGHSFLCLYGGPAGKQGPPLPIPSREEHPSQNSGQSSTQPSDSVVVNLREQLQCVRQELQRIRAHHRHCEALQDEVRQLRARCEEYEALLLDANEPQHDSADGFNGSRRPSAQSISVNMQATSGSMSCISGGSRSSQNLSICSSRTASPSKAANSLDAEHQAFPNPHMPLPSGCVPQSDLTTAGVDPAGQLQRPCERRQHGLRHGNASLGDTLPGALSGAGLIGDNRLLPCQNPAPQYSRSAAYGNYSAVPRANVFSSVAGHDCVISGERSLPFDSPQTCHTNQGLSQKTQPAASQILGPDAPLNSDIQWYSSEMPVDAVNFESLLPQGVLEPAPLSISPAQWSMACQAAPSHWSLHPPMVSNQQANLLEQNYTQYLSSLSVPTTQQSSGRTHAWPS